MLIFRLTSFSEYSTSLLILFYLVEEDFRFVNGSFRSRWNFFAFFILTKRPDSLDRSSKEKDDKMNKFKQVAVKAKKELETQKKQV